MLFISRLINSESVREMKSLADAPAFYNNLAFGNAVSHQQLMNNIIGF